MAFRENILRKIQIDQLAGQVRLSMKPADPPQRIDRKAMQALLGMSQYVLHRERDLDLYRKEGQAPGKQLILVLDNELKIYHTTIDDVALRKSPTIKEMISIRNAIKILNDKDVVLSSKADTLQRLQNELVAALDLSYATADIDALERDGRESLKNSYNEGLIEVLTLFAELLGYAQAPKAFQARHHHVWGAPDTSVPGTVQMGPIVLLSLMHNTLKMIRNPISTMNKGAMQWYAQIMAGQAEADLEGDAVLAELTKRVLARKKGV